MAQLLIEENFQHLDGQDVESLIEALAGLGLRAEPTQPRSRTHSAGWTLVLHWLLDDTGPITGDAVPAALVAAVTGTLGQPHPVGNSGSSVRDRTLPARIDIRGRAGELLTSVAVPGADTGPGPNPRPGAEPRPPVSLWRRGRHPAATDDGTPRLVPSAPAAER
ncbi:hypothetical protein [Streptacidiphilus sp. P02-A3a]|uniref:hypothetical protein n=1 Tax=Streptacidiphilus sp. P02-A3a TaxID=2704468 RepID=UPI0015FE35B0|nr:hypothetical protein [Streptacidiphilus sp. P02-A3a]QMU69888.1 hypothetical protein GXP74_18370 [Streptacidiphilus sp. P02-A3a]